jgi:hypothetical protein
MHRQGRFSLLFSLLLLLLPGIAACGGLSPQPAAGPPPINPLLQNPLPTDASVSSTQLSSVQLTLSGAEHGFFRLQTDSITSKLRHGHLEFTIFLAQGDRSFFIAFHGYTGPRAYTLLSIENGGDLHLALGKDRSTWDLSLHQTATCQLLVQSEVPTSAVEIHRMKGRFSCPALYSSDPGASDRTVAVSQGLFDISILIES